VVLVVVVGRRATVVEVVVGPVVVVVVVGTVVVVVVVATTVPDGAAGAVVGGADAQAPAACEPTMVAMRLTAPSAAAIRLGEREVSINGFGFDAEGLTPAMRAFGRHVSNPVGDQDSGSRQKHPSGAAC
jgi:hypothetical protein